MSRVRLEHINIKLLQNPDGDMRREQLARRLYNLWSRVYDHLADEDYRFMLRHHLDDFSPSTFELTFYRLPSGEDVGAAIIRFNDEVINGRAVTRCSANVGFLRTHARSASLSRFLPYALMRYKLRHPLKTVYFVECPMTPASYLVMVKNIIWTYPSSRRAFPPRLQALADHTAAAFGWQPIPGRPGVYAVGCRRRLEEAERSSYIRRAERDPDLRLYLQRTDLEDGVGMLVIAPVSAVNLFVSSGYAILRGVIKRLRPSARNARPARQNPRASSELRREQPPEPPAPSPIGPRVRDEHALVGEAKSPRD